MRKILIYADRGVDGMSLKQLVRSLQDAKELSSFEFKRIDAAGLLSESWESDADLLIIPGGRDVFYHSALDGIGTDKIRAFVEAGGNYLGICAGAYFACRAIEFEKGGALEVCAPRSLQFFPGIAQGPAYGPNKYSYENAKGAEAARISWKSQECAVYFNGGCTFLPDDPATSGLPLSAYLDLPGQPHAILELPVGKGRAILSGVHFEYSPQYMKADDPHLDPIREKLSEHEPMRRTIFTDILTRLVC